jgi:predicted nucleotidyltransferase
MRLSNIEREIIKEAAQNIYDKDAKIFIFGSRVDDTKKGGDIDIYIETPKHATIKDKLNFLVALENKIGEQKVDIIIKTPISKPKEIFEIAKNNGILL